MELLIRPFTREDFSTLVGWIPDERSLVEWAGPGLSFPLDADQLAAIMAESTGEQPRRLAWMATPAASPAKTIGHFQIAYDRRCDTATLARVILAPQARGRGLANSLVQLAVDQAFVDENVFRLELNVYDFNTPAIRTYEKVGFVREGIRRQSAPVCGKRWNTVIMSILRPEWISHNKSK